MPRPEDLELTHEPVGQPISGDELPTQYGPRKPILQPGLYRFRLPAGVSHMCQLFEANVVARDAQGHEQTQVVERMRVVYADEPLIIVDSPGGRRDGETFQWRVSNAERWRNRRHTVLASDMDYLLQAFGHRPHPGFGNNQGYIEALNKYGGRSLAARVDISWFGNATREIYVSDPQGRPVKVPGVYGNGKRATTRQIPKDAVGNYPETIDVPITARDPDTGQKVEYTAIVRGFNDLSHFQAMRDDEREGVAWHECSGTGSPGRRCKRPRRHQGSYVHLRSRC